MNNDNRYTLVDVLVEVISPTLIIALVGSLVFFLIEIFYDGEYPFQVQWIFFFFVIGMVLVARVSMSREIAGRWAGYGLVLAIVSFLALQMFVDYSETPLRGMGSVVNLGLIGVVWWCAHKLTWDCTYQDADSEGGGPGVLAAAGLDTSGEKKDPAEDDGQPKERTDVPVPEADGPDGTARPRKKRKKKKRARKEPEAPAQPSWWQRYRKHREEQLKKHTPGTWVLYFSLAALPLYGLGQARIPLEEEGRRQYTFWLIVIYLASGLSLLLSTHFLGLRRYLKKRGVRLPASIITRWLSMGAIVIVAVLALGAILPRPYSEYSVFNFSQAGSEEKEPGKGGGGGPEGEEGEARRDSSAEKGGGGSGSAQGSGSGSGSGDKKGSKGSGSDKGLNGEKSSKGSGSGGKGSGGSGGKFAPRRSFKPRSGKPPTNWLSSLGTTGKVLKWIVIGIAVLVIAFVVLRSGLSFLAGFTNWAARLLQALQKWWEWLFGAREGNRSSRQASPALPAPAPPRPFSAFRNPFADGSAPGMSPEEVVRYTFEAVEAWASDRDQARASDETPLEFAARLGEQAPDLAEDLNKLVTLYSRMAYGGARLPESVRGSLRQFWERLEEASAVVHA